MLGTLAFDRLACLKVSVRIVRRAADEWNFGIECPPAMGPHQIVSNHRADVAIRQQGQGIQFVRGTKSVKEVQEGYARFERRSGHSMGRV